MRLSKAGEVPGNEDSSFAESVSDGSGSDGNFELDSSNNPSLKGASTAGFNVEAGAGHTWPTSRVLCSRSLALLLSPLMLAPPTPGVTDAAPGSAAEEALTPSEEVAIISGGPDIRRAGGGGGVGDGGVLELWRGAGEG